MFSFLVDIIYRGTQSSPGKRIFMTTVAMLSFLSFVGALFWAAMFLDSILGLPEAVSYPLNTYISLPLLTAGYLFVIWSNLFFLKTRGTPIPFNPPPRLVVTGPYAYSRNAMLSGAFLMLFGLGILLRSVTMTCVVFPLFVYIMCVELKFIEEPELEKRLGREYSDYRKRVPMFVPKTFTSGKGTS